MLRPDFRKPQSARPVPAISYLGLESVLDVIAPISLMHWHQTIGRSTGSLAMEIYCRQTPCQWTWRHQGTHARSWAATSPTAARTSFKHILLVRTRTRSLLCVARQDAKRSLRTGRTAPGTKGSILKALADTSAQTVHAVSVDRILCMITVEDTVGRSQK